MLLSGRATSRKRGGGGFWGGEEGEGGVGRAGYSAQRGGMKSSPGSAAPRYAAPPAPRHPRPLSHGPAAFPPLPRSAQLAGSPRGERGRPGVGGPERCPLGHCFFSLIPGAAELEIAGWPCGRERSAGLDPALGGFGGEHVILSGPGGRCLSPGGPRRSGRVGVWGGPAAFSFVSPGFGEGMGRPWGPAVRGGGGGRRQGR